MIQSPIIIYQPGKVASSTVEATLNEVSLEKVIHIHRLSAKNYNNYLDVLKRNPPTNKEGSLTGNLKKRGMFEAVKNYYRMHKIRGVIKNKEAVKIITIVREPIARNRSAFFQNIDIIESEYKTQPIDNILNLFWKRYNHDNILNWFEYEFKEVLGFDIYANAFDKEKGYTKYEHNGNEIFLLKVEKLNDIYSELFSDMGYDIKELLNTNIGNNKSYKSIYKEFNEKLVFPEDYINKMYSSKYSTHFYTNEEIESFKEKLKRK